MNAALPHRLILIGTSGGACDVLEIIVALGKEKAASFWQIDGFLDDAKSLQDKYLGYPVLGRLSEASRYHDAFFLNIIGSDTSYRRRLEIIRSTGLTADKFTTLVHPQASVSSWARLGRGAYVSFGASIGGGVVVGDHVSLSPGSIIGHDTSLGDGTLVAPGAVISGFVSVGRCCYIGAGAMVRQRLKIGDGALVGMGAVVTKDVSPGSIVVGNPARELRKGH